MVTNIDTVGAEKIQLKYRAEPARTKEKLRGLTENVLKTISIDEEDEEATNAIREDSEQSRDRWRNMMSLTTLPILGETYPRDIG